MYRFRSCRFIGFYSNAFHNLSTNGKLCVNSQVWIKSSVRSLCSSQSNSIDVHKTSIGSKSLADLRDKRLHQMKRNLAVQEYDVLTEAIINCVTIDQVLDLVSMHVNVMNNRHMADVFESLHNIVRQSNNYAEDCLKILSSKEFSDLCNQAIRRMRFFQTSDLLTTFKALILLRISPNTTIVQSLLQMTRQLINDFSINEIIFLDFLLNRRLIERNDSLNETEVENFENEENFLTRRLLQQSVNEEKETKKPTIVPLIEALKLAIPLVLQLKIESKELNFDDIDLVVKCLRAVAKHNLKDEVIDKLTLAVSYKIFELTVPQMFSIIASLTWVPTHNTNVNTTLVHRVINQCLDRVTAPGVIIPSNTSHNFIISLITHKRQRDFYHKGLYEMVANLIIQKPTEFHISKATAVLNTLTSHYHIHYGLLDFVAKKIALRDPELIDSKKASFTNILGSFALPANYRPNESNSDDIYKIILSTNHINLCKEKTQHLLFKMLKNLAILNYYPKQEITEWFNNHFKSAISGSTVIGLRIDFLQSIRYLYQGLCLEANLENMDYLKHSLKAYVDELVEFEIKEVENVIKSETLEFALTQGLGGKQFFANNLFTGFGHHIDYVLAMRKGGYPININTNDEKISHITQLNLPSDAKIYGILLLDFKDYCREPAIKKGDTDFKIRTLKKCGVNPIIIKLENWELLSEVEKVPYIMREINENSKLEELQSNCR
ncbi:uncharacterized protein LOC128952843 [Oppia nitens]|uniref:uncharacterized protein LOC128952843 n=1 Tax=Oppia nitens TaxID=1686743 RepID=UPI0023DCBF77|nr:uncharacterized protein LOC128952843 [Oppia nitens]